MPGTSKVTASKAQRVEGIVDDRSEDVDGYTISFTTLLGDMDGAPMLRGAPDDRCQCPHWGYVLAGTITFRFPDHDETYAVGDAYYVPPGHTPVLTAGTEVVQFQPAAEMARMVEIMSANARAMMGQGQPV